MKLADKDKAVKGENTNKVESKIMENISEKVNIIEGGVTAAKGFEAAAAAAEIKYKGRTDMALIYS